MPSPSPNLPEPPRRPRGLRRWAAVALSFLLVLGLGIFLGVLSQHMEKMFGRRYDPTDGGDLRELRKLTYLAHPLVAAAEASLAKQGKAPESAVDLPGLPPHYWVSLDVPYITYTPEGTNFRIYIKLGWDPFLIYDHATKQWTYDPGDGRSQTVIPD